MKSLMRYKTTSRKRLSFIVFEADTEGVEILMAFWMFLLSVAFWAYGPAMLRNPAFSLLGAMAPSAAWGLVTLAITVSKTLSVFYDSSRWRLASVVAGAFVWLLVTGSVWLGPNVGLGTLLNPAFALVSAWLAWRIGWKAGRKEHRE